MGSRKAWQIAVLAGLVGACAPTPEPQTTKAAAAAPALTDAEIAAIVVAANGTDADMGEWAAAKTSNAAVKEFANTMMRDHRAVNEQAGALVSRLGVTPVASTLSAKLVQDGAAVRAELSGKAGAEFDRAYIDHEVGYHRAVIDAVDQVLLPATTNAELKAAIEGVRPALVAHLRHAEQLQTALRP